MKRFGTHGKKLLLLGVLAAIALLTFGCSETTTQQTVVIQPRPYTERPQIAVVEFENRTGRYGMGTGMADMLESALIRTQRYNVASRRQWGNVLQEQMRQDAFVDPHTAAQTGRLIGVKYLITGSVNQALVEPVDLSFPGFNMQGNKATVWVTLQVIDVETALIVDAPEAFGTATAASIRVEDVQVGSPGWDSTLLGKACRDAITKLVNQMTATF